MYSRQTQKLIYWLISDFSNFWNGRPVGTNPTEYEMYKAKQQLKEAYIKLFNFKLNKKPLNTFLKVLETKDNKSIGELQDAFIMALQSFLLGNNDFSLALQLMTQEKANRFVSFLFELALDNNVPLRKEIVELYAEQQNEKYIFTTLARKKCAVCGKYGDLDHWDNVAQVGGYKYDTGLDLRYICLCREHHTEKHNIGRLKFKEKYHMEGIYLDPGKVEILKKIYPNHFKAYKKEA